VPGFIGSALSKVLVITQISAFWATRIAGGQSGPVRYPEGILPSSPGLFRTAGTTLGYLKKRILP
jgi:hypothetical protein